MKKYSLQMISLLMVWLIVMLSFPAWAIEINEVTYKQSDRIAWINWTTDVDSDSKVEYGQTDINLDEDVSNDVLVKQHSLFLTRLLPGTRYYFSVSSDDGSGEIVDDNDGDMYTFETLPLQPPFILTEIPEYFTESHNFPLSLLTVSEAIIRIYINDDIEEDVPHAVTTADEIGNLEATLPVLEGVNRLKLEIRDPESSLQVINDYEFIVDTAAPNVIVSNIPSVTFNHTLMVKGSVNENSTVKVSLKFQGESTSLPEKVSGLTVNPEENSVELEWDEVEGAEEYIIYRDGIAITTWRDNAFEDPGLNTGVSYTYQISAIDDNCNEGLKSDSITATTLEGGFNVEPISEEIEVVCEEHVTTIKTNGSFEAEFDLNEDGFYDVEVLATDIAGNVNKQTYQIFLDTQPPTIEILEPTDGLEIFENHADEVRIKGRTKPNTTVYLYVERFPNGPFDYTIALSDFPDEFPDEIEDISEAKLDPTCSCTTGANYAVKSDMNGYFEFTSVDLTSMWGGMLKIENIPNYATYLRDTARDVTGYQDNPQANLVFVATDSLGRRGAEAISYDLVTCWSGNFTWDVVPLSQYQSPTFISTERLAEGTEYLYFYFNFSYYGNADNAYVSQLSIASACDKIVQQDPRFNTSCKVMQKSCTSKLNPSGTTAYVTCKLDRYEDMDVWAGDDWDAFFDAIKSEMVFPMKLRLIYTEKTGESESTQEQTFCESVTYVVDNARIDPREVLPDWLLYDAVDWLNSSITTLNEVIEKLDEVLRIAAVGCAISFIVKFVIQIYRRFTCKFEDFTRQAEAFTGMATSDQDDCAVCLVKFKAIQNKGDANKIQQERIPDQCMQKCAPGCSAAWGSEASLYQAFRWTCDRVLGHDAPSKWTEKVKDKDLIKKKEQGSTCNNDQSMFGQPIRSAKCSVLENEKAVGVKLTKFTTGQDCWPVNINTGDPTAEYIYTNPTVVDAKANLYSFDKLEFTRKGSAINGPPEIYALKQSETNYLTSRNQECSQVCGLDKYIEPQKVRDRTLDTTQKDGKDVVNAGWSCVEASACAKLNEAPKENSATGKDESGKTVQSDRRGYTVDCFYNQGGVYHTSKPYATTTNVIKNKALPNKVSVVSNDEEQRYECCCINPSKQDPSPYYTRSDVPSRDDPEIAATALDDMKWSYRYAQIGYVVPEWDSDGKNTGTKNQYNPDRYIKERDQPACFGQNQWLMDGFSGKDGNLLRMDPAKDWLATFQCVSLSHIIARLRMVTNIMNALRNCLLEVRTTGRADSGVCKELFTQYVCSFIWDIITWIRDGCLPWGEGITFGGEGLLGDTLSAGAESITESISATQGELSKEYGNAKLTNLFGAGQESIARKLCLAAFGYDWEIGVEDLIDVSYSTPFATLVQPILPKREYLTFDPTNSRAKYEYRSSWLINPGCDIDSYNVELACVSLNELDRRPGINCEKQGSLDGSNCDCLLLPQEEKHSFYQGRSLTQNELEDIDHHDIITAKYRYDHLKFSLRVDREISRSGDVSKCFPEGHEDGVFYFPITDNSASDIAACRLSPDGSFDCSSAASFFYSQGLAYFNGVQVGDSTDWQAHTKSDSVSEGRTVHVGRPVTVKVDIVKDEKPQCIVYYLKDADTGNILNARLARTLEENSPSGQLTLGNVLGRNVAQSDITGQITKVTFRESDGTDHGNQLPGLTVGTAEKSVTELQQKSPTFSIVDTNADGVLVFDDDSYRIGTNPPKLFRNNVRNRNEIDLGNGVIFPISVSTGFDFKGSNQRTFTANIEVTTTSGQLSTEKRWILHLDLRPPKGGSVDCAAVKEKEFDQNILIAGGKRQSFDIPIYLTNAKPVEGACVGQGWHIQNQLCVCGDTKEKNCGSDDFGKYCYDDNDDSASPSCHKTPACELDKDLTEQCNCVLTDDVVDCPKNNYKYCHDNGGVANGKKNYECKEGIAPRIDTDPIDASDIQIFIGNNLVTTAVTEAEINNVKPFIYRTPARNLIVKIKDVITPGEADRVEDKVKVRFGAESAKNLKLVPSQTTDWIGYTTVENLKLEDQTIFIDFYDEINDGRSDNFIKTGTMVIQIGVETTPASSGSQSSSGGAQGANIGTQGNGGTGSTRPPGSVVI